MAFDRFAVAIQWREGKYDVIAKTACDQSLDWNALVTAYPLNNVSDVGAGYTDRATVVATHRFREFITDELLFKWFDGPAATATFILVHEAEWDSGLGD